VRITQERVLRTLAVCFAEEQAGDRAQIYSISSTAGQRGDCCTRIRRFEGGIISLTKGLATELAGKGIGETSVAPGCVARIARRS